MARLRRKDIADANIAGLKYFDRLMPLLGRLHDVGTGRDRAGNREFFFDHYCAYILLFLFNSIVDRCTACNRPANSKKCRRSSAGRAFRSARSLKPLRCSTLHRSSDPKYSLEVR